MQQSLRARFWLECLLLVISGFTALATLAYPRWLESVTGLDPDGGNGAAEWVVTLTLTAITLAGFVAARAEWHRGRSAARASAKSRLGGAATAEQFMIICSGRLRRRAR